MPGHSSRGTLLICLLFLFLIPAWALSPNVLLVVLDNAGFDAALNVETYVSLQQQGLLLTNYHGVGHPSLPNHVALVGGDTWGLTDDEFHEIGGACLADLLEEQHITWKSYVENYPGGCYKEKFGVGENTLYSRAHNPFIMFTAVTNDNGRCARVVDADEFTVDVHSDQLPRFSLYIPNQANGGHDTDAAVTGTWLEWFLSKYQRHLTNTIIVVTSGEERESNANHVWTMVLHANPPTDEAMSAFENHTALVPGSRDDGRYDHYSLLRSIETLFGLGSLGRRDAVASVIPYFQRWSQPAGSELSEPWSSSEKMMVVAGVLSLLTILAVVTWSRFSRLSRFAPQPLLEFRSLD